MNVNRKLEAVSPQLQALRNGDLAGVRELRLPGLREFPRELFGLADSLELLDLSGGELTELPDDLGRFHKLRILFCSDNLFETLPPALSDCISLSQIGFRRTRMRKVPGESLPPSLRWLILTDNQIAELPKQIGERPRLQKLMVSGNQIRVLPDNMANAKNLELVRLSSNLLDKPPSCLLELPSLAWVSWAGSPLERGLAPSGAARIRWADLDVGEKLGEGTSGQVHRAHWRAASDEAERRVALKIFKGAMTSDGLPEREIETCLAAGHHPQLTAALGQVIDHPQGLRALVMPLLPDHWCPLADPPSLKSCSRDVYDLAFQISLNKARRIAGKVATATAHLHSRGIIHGDLYAHNVIWDRQAGECVLGDFGAACVLPTGAERHAWQRIEVRAWGLLIGELLDRCPEASSESRKLRALEHACVQAAPSRRPLMSDVIEALEQVSAAQ